MSLSDALKLRKGRTWTLFVDRDGVINRRNRDGYILNWGQFDYIPGSLDALAALTRVAPQTVVITNQAGIGKGIMTEESLMRIHERMTRDVADCGGHLDAVYFCPHLSTDGCFCRKPQPGLALSWLESHPCSDASLAVMVGDSASDIEMLDRLASHTGGGMSVGVGPDVRGQAHLSVSSLAEFQDLVKRAGLR